MTHGMTRQCSSASGLEPTSSWFWIHPLWWTRLWVHCSGSQETVYPWTARRPGSHLYGTFKLTGSEKKERQRALCLWIRIPPQLCHFAPRQRKKHLDCTESMFYRRHVVERRSRISNWRSSDFAHEEEPRSRHLFLHTFDNQIFTVLSLKGENREKEGGLMSKGNQEEHNKGRR